MSRFRRRPSGSMLVALLALVMAMSGSAMAAALITSAQIKDGTIQTKDLAKKTISALKGKTGANGATGATGAAGVAGPQGPAGAKGDIGPAGAKGDTGAAGAKGETGQQGQPGERGPSDGYAVGDGDTATSAPPLTLIMPPGDYIAVGKVAAYAATAANVNVSCTVAGGTTTSRAYGTIQQSGVTQTTLVVTAAVHLAAAGAVTLSCGNTTNTFGYANMTAVQVGTLH
jgi:hypothetical protein